MGVIAFHHVPFEGLGRIGAVLQAGGIEVRCADLHLPGAVLPDTADADGLIFMGGPMSVNDDLAYLRQERELIREAVERGQPVLGVCLGAQLIAAALGAAVYPNHTKEIGWYDIQFTDAGAGDPLFRGLGKRETVLQWHGETFDLPEGAVLLATSEACVNQAFRLGDRVYGLQFHLEATPEMIADWCRQDQNCGDVRELGGPVDATRHAGRMQELSDTVFGRWVRSLDGE
jgi:GMP synthase (glutamine-hydrolysing)